MGLRYFGIRVRELDRSIDFYTRLVGLRELRRGQAPHGGRWVLLQDDRSRQRLELNWYPEGTTFATPYTAGEGLDHISITAGGSAARTFRRLVKAGAAPALAPSDPTVSRGSTSSPTRMGTGSRYSEPMNRVRPRGSESARTRAVGARSRVGGVARRTPTAARKAGASTGPGDVDRYLAGVPAPFRRLLERLRTTIRAAAPEAQEVVSYGMPAFRQDGMLVYYAAFRDHCSFFAGSASVRARFAAEVRPYESGKGTLRFTPARPLPTSLVIKIVRARVAENKARQRLRPPRGASTAGRRS